MGLFGKKGKGTELLITASPMSHKGGILDTTQNLSALKMKEKPFESKLTVRFEVDHYEGKDAIEIYLNDELIGEVPGFMVEKITPLLDPSYLGLGVRHLAFIWSIFVHGRICI